MSKKTIEQRLAEIKDLSLPAYEPRLRHRLLRSHAKQALAPSDDPTGYVVDGSMVSFVANLDPQFQSDVLNSTLLAQLAANKKYDRETNTVEWYKFYRNVLENVGWVVQSFDFLKYNASGDSFTVNSVVVDVLKAIATGNEIAIVAQSLDALKALSGDDGRLVLWDSSTHSASAGNFQLGVASMSGGNVIMKLGTFYFSTTESTTSFLWFSYSSTEMSLYKGGQSIVLNEEIYSKVRQTVIDKLGKAAQDFVGNLDI